MPEVSVRIGSRLAHPKVIRQNPLTKSTESVKIRSEMPFEMRKLVGRDKRMIKESLLEDHAAGIMTQSIKTSNEHQNFPLRTFSRNSKLMGNVTKPDCSKKLPVLTLSRTGSGRSIDDENISLMEARMKDGQDIVRHKNNLLNF